ncbi:Uncharacterised protein [Arachnia propionica]|uniref:Uncharacterized protein n=1 Tax=Arachnia propionica TaxID=1750 RepID=A0A3S4UTB4_9ACTN|nr:Uncharacterised protein [Arachnia propionica]
MRSGKAPSVTPEGRYWWLSQWSLTFEVRKSIIGELDLVKVDGSQWSLTFEVRKSTRLPPSAERPASQWSLTFEVRKS